jgi:hypothetical protein
MAKGPRPDLPLPEEALDKSIGVLEGPVNRVLERVWKSRVVLVPVGIVNAIVWKSLGAVLPSMTSPTEPKNKRETR